MNASPISVKAAVNELAANTVTSPDAAGTVDGASVVGASVVGAAVVVGAIVVGAIVVGAIVVGVVAIDLESLPHEAVKASRTKAGIRSRGVLPMVRRIVIKLLNQHHRLTISTPRHGDESSHEPTRFQGRSEQRAARRRDDTGVETRHVQATAESGMLDLQAAIHHCRPAGVGDDLDGLC
jgi:hypothetical protein